MTDEELDLLASAYVDGEATPDEVALVERDPELQARVEVFRAVKVDDAAVTPPPGLLDRHVAAALAEFDATAGSNTPDQLGTTAPVVDLRDAAASRADGAATTGRRTADRAAGRTRRRTARTMPAWLPAAAGFVIVGGGFLWAVGQTGGDDDDAADTEAAAIETDAGDDEAEAMDEGAEDSAAMSAMSDDAMEESDEGDDAMAEDGAAESDRTTGGAADADAAAPADEDESTEDAEESLVEPEPLLFFDEIPDVDAIEELPEPETDLERSLCGPEIITDALGEFIGFVPVVVQDELAEIYLFEDGDGAEIRLLIDERCQPLESELS